MKYLRIFESWISNEDLLINESVQAAKAFMLKRLADRLNKPVQELSPEEQAQALSEPKYKEILALLGDKYRGYAGAFTNFIFLQRIAIEQLRLLLTKIADNREFIGSLPHTVEEYSKGNPDKEARISGFEALMDQFTKEEFRRKGKWIIDKLPKILRDKARAATPEEQQALLGIGADSVYDSPKPRENIMSKINAFLDKPISDFIDFANRYTDALKSDNNAISLVSKAKSFSPAVNVMYDDERYVVLSPRTETAQKALHSIAPKWCINNWAWKTYAKTGIQINIFDFGVPTTDRLHLTGTTVYYTGEVRTAADLQNSPLSGSRQLEGAFSKDPAKHFTMAGYPPELVNTLVENIPKEISIKRALDEILDDMKANATKQQLLTKILKTGYSIELLNPEDRDRVEKEVINVVDQEIGQQIDIQDVVNSFKEDTGVLSTFAAKLYNKLVKGSTISETDKQAILDKTLRGFRIIETAIKTAQETGAKKYNPASLSKMQAVLAVKDQILAMIAD
jgi:hypothetical protein